MQTIEMAVVGLGAWGPGFDDWPSLCSLLTATDNPVEPLVAKPPKPAIIPANERRRAPLPVKIAVEVSSQALAQSGFQSEDVACVFGSGLGDTEITDYMCRVLTTELKQLSPTKFHNSVHNAAAGYWTISSACMKSANSIAAYNDTVGMCLLEGMMQSHLHNEPVLITVFDTKAHDTYQDIFTTRESFAAAVLVCPQSLATQSDIIATLALETCDASSNSPLDTACQALVSLHSSNPSARILPLLQALIEPAANVQLPFSVSAQSAVSVSVSKPSLSKPFLSKPK